MLLMTENKIVIKALTPSVAGTVASCYVDREFHSISNLVTANFLFDVFALKS